MVIGSLIIKDNIISSHKLSKLILNKINNTNNNCHFLNNNNKNNNNFINHNSKNNNIHNITDFEVKTSKINNIMVLEIINQNNNNNNHNNRMYYLNNNNIKINNRININTTTNNFQNKINNHNIMVLEIMSNLIINIHNKIK